jgi:hypothetical protein
MRFRTLPMKRAFLALLFVPLAACAGHTGNRLGDDPLIESAFFNGVAIRFSEPVRQAHRSTFGDGTTDVDELSTPDHVIAVFRDTLYMDNCSYGRIAQSDDMLIRAGRVTVNGDRRPPKPLTDAATIKALWLRPTVEANHNGRTFIVSPGRTISTYSIRPGSEYVIIGLPAIRIRSGNLFVSGVPYGPVSTTAEISVHRDAVRVDGCPHKPVQRAARPLSVATK